MEPYKKCTNFPVNTLRAINHQLIYAKVLILANSTPNKNQTYIYSLGESYSIHWTMRANASAKVLKLFEINK